jgi:hypothetical protein
VPIYQERGNPVATARTLLLLLTQALSSIGETESATARFAAATDALMEHQAWRLAADAAMHAAMHSERVRDDDEAVRRHAQAASAFAQCGEPVLSARAARRQAKVTWQGDQALGRALFATALELVQALSADHGIDIGWELADWNDDMAWALWSAYENEEAMPYSSAAEAGYAASGDAAGSGRAALFASQLLIEREDFLGARAHASRARAIFLDAGLDELVERAQNKLDLLPEAP